MINIDVVGFFLSQLGIAGVFVWWSTQLRNDRKETEKRKDQYADKVLAAFEENTKVNSELKYTLEGNTKAIDNLTDKINYVIKL